MMRVKPCIYYGLFVCILAASLLFPQNTNAQMDEKSKLVKSNYFGDFHQAKKIKKQGKESLKIWEPQLKYIKSVSPSFLEVSGGIEKLDVEYDEIWIYENTDGLTSSEKKKYKGKNDLHKGYFYKNKIQACTVEKWFIGNPLTGAKLSKPSHKIWNINARNFILKKLEEN
jgi:hypothetical protein